MIPGHIGDAASRGDLATIRAYFEDDSDGARDVDDGVPPSGSTLLMKCAWGDVRGRTIRGHVEAARYLLSLGAYCRLPHKQVLRLRSLLVRGRAQGTLRTEPRIRWLLKLPNDPLWHVLSYWRATE